jgi:hypothetical protein
MKNQQLFPIKIPVIADYILSPIVSYGENFTSINFETQDEEFGRITFQNIDSIKICRGELPPYEDNSEFEIGDWVYKVQDSEWLQERYHYEKKHYSQSYEWGNSVEEMLTDYTHYFFRFHDEFVEAIAKGFWFEQGIESYIGKSLSPNHPFLKIDNNYTDEFILGDKKYYFKFNTSDIKTLEHQSKYCQQTLIEVWLSIPNEECMDGSLKIKNINGNVISYYQPTFGKAEIIKNGLATIEDLKNYIKAR